MRYWVIRSVLHAEQSSFFGCEFGAIDRWQVDEHDITFVLESSINVAQQPIRGSTSGVVTYLDLNVWHYTPPERVFDNVLERSELRRVES